MLQQLVRREIVWTVIFTGDGLFGLLTHITLFGRLLDGMFVIRRFSLLYGWVSVEVGFGAPLTPPLRLLFEGTIPRCVPLFLVVISFRCVHHVYIVR